MRYKNLVERRPLNVMLSEGSCKKREGERGCWHRQQKIIFKYACGINYFSHVNDFIILNCHWFYIKWKLSGTRGKECTDHVSNQVFAVLNCSWKLMLGRITSGVCIGLHFKKQWLLYCRCKPESASFGSDW